jgi:hypothetical protein
MSANLRKATHPGLILRHVLIPNVDNNITAAAYGKTAKPRRGEIIIPKQLVGRADKPRRGDITIDVTE